MCILCVSPQPHDVAACACTPLCRASSRRWSTTARSSPSWSRRCPHRWRLPWAQAMRHRWCSSCRWSSRTCTTTLCTLLRGLSACTSRYGCGVGGGLKDGTEASAEGPLVLLIAHGAGAAVTGAQGTVSTGCAHKCAALQCKHEMWSPPVAPLYSTLLHHPPLACRCSVVRMHSSRSAGLRGTTPTPSRNQKRECSNWNFGRSRHGSLQWPLCVHALQTLILCTCVVFFQAHGCDEPKT